MREWRTEWSFVDAELDDAPPLVRMPVDVKGVALTTLAALAVLAALRLAGDLLVPLVLGILGSYALTPVVSALSSRWVPRPVAAAIVVLTLMVFVAASAYTLSDEAATVLRELPTAAQTLRQTMRSAVRGQAAPLDQLNLAAREIERAAVETTGQSPPVHGATKVQVVEPAVDVMGVLRWGSAGAVVVAGQLVLLAFFVYFVLASGDLYKRKLVRLAGPRMSNRRVTVEIVDEIGSQIASFLWHLVLAGAIVGVTTGFTFWMLGVNQPVVWGLAAAVLNSIPYFGPVVILCVSMAVALVQFGTLKMALLVGAVSVAITSVEGFLLTPWLMSRAGRMNAVAVFVGLIFWGWMWGLWGMLLATPILMVTKIVSERIERLRPLAELLGE